MKRITFYIVLFALTTVASFGQTARVQVIHNSADAAASVVDVYVNGGILLDDFEFRTASPFVNAPAGIPLTIVVAPGNSTSAADGIFTANATLTANETYIIVANGIVSTTGYTPNQPFNLYIYNMGREEASSSANTDILVFHGATDAPVVDAVEPGVGIAVNNIGYGQFQGYLELPTDDYMLDITTADNSVVVASYSVPLDFLNLDGQALTVLASGFLDPSTNSNGPAFGLWVATAAGGPLLQLPAADAMARVQVIHNSADMAAAVVDVYVNGDILLDDFAFRTASPFIDAPAGLPLTISIAPGNSTSADDSIYTIDTMFEDGETYIVVANGIVSATGYSPATPFNLYVYAMGREEASTTGNTDILVFHGATDAPTVDVTAQGAGTLINDISYSDFDGYLELPTNNYTISITTSDGNTVVATYSAPLQTLNLQNQALTVLASGFLDPSVNSGGPAFGLWVALPAGGDLVELPLGELNSKSFNSATVAIYPNPAKDLVNITVPDGYSTITTAIFDMAGRNVLNATGTTVDTSGLNNGIYMANINIDGVTITRKIVKE